MVRVETPRGVPPDDPPAAPPLTLWHPVENPVIAPNRRITARTRRVGCVKTRARRPMGSTRKSSPASAVPPAARGQKGTSRRAADAGPPVRKVVTVKATVPVGTTCWGLGVQVMSSWVGTAHTTLIWLLNPPRPATTNEAEPAVPLMMFRLVGELAPDGAMEKSSTLMVMELEVPAA